MSQYNMSMCTHQAHHLSNIVLLHVENYNKKCKIYGIKMKKYITYKMCSIPISFYEWMILTCNILKPKGKIRDPPVKSYVMMPEISAERFLEILKNKNRFLYILCEKATHISW